MFLWIGSGLGAARKFLADNGGEFPDEEFWDMCKNLNIEVIKTAAESPWQNGLYEQNHCVTDRCLEKILEDDPEMPLNIAYGIAFLLIKFYFAKILIFLM